MVNQHAHSSSCSCFCHPWFLPVLFMRALVCDCVLVAVARRIKFGLALVI